MTALSDLVEPLKRELAVPGTFEDVFPLTDDDALEASLADGFAEAQLRGFFGTYTVTEDEGFQTDPDITAAGGALVLIFTSMRIIRAQLRAMLSSERYKAGPVEIETTRSANLLRDELKYLDQRLKDLIADAQRAARAVDVSVFDNYTARTAVQLHLLGGFAAPELPNVIVGW